MQLTLFEPTNKRFSRNTYHDKKGRFCSKEEDMKRRLEYWKRKAESYERAYLAVAKRLIKIERNEQ